MALFVVVVGVGAAVVPAAAPPVFAACAASAPEPSSKMLQTIALTLRTCKSKPLSSACGVS